MSTAVPSKTQNTPGRYGPYPRYKGSGAEWLGEIPAHWIKLALKRIGSLQAGAGFPYGEQGVLDEEIPFFKVGDMAMPGNELDMRVWQHTVSRPTARRLGAFVFPPGTIVFAKVGAALLLNRRRLLSAPSCLDNNMMGFMPDDCDPTWAMYWLSSLDMGELANPGAVPSVNEGQMRETPALVPPLQEQRAIAAFLDRETTRIDGLIEKKRRQIELLHEKRAALISHAVTKGLNPNAPMKDSGIEWLGEVPAHWEVLPLRALAQPGYRNFTDGDWIESPFIQDMGIRLIQTGNIGVGYYKEQGFRYIDEETFRKLRCTEVMPGDVLICRLADPVGRACLAPDLGVRMITSVDVCILKPAQQVAPTFVVHSLSSIEYLSWMTWICRGGTRDRVSRSMLGSIRVHQPPLAEQHTIAAFLDRETARIDSLIDKVELSIDRLREYRTALISAAVTGKIDVREEVV